MRIAATLTTLVLAGAFAFTGCDSDDDDTSSSSETGGGDRAADILSMPGDAAAGEAVFTGTCGIAACHSADGSGSATVGHLNTLVPNLTPDQIVASLLDGKGGMPSQAGLSDAELADSIAYIEENFAM